MPARYRGSPRDTRHLCGRFDLNPAADVNNRDDPDIDITFYQDVAAGVNDESLVEVSLGTD